MRPWPAHDTRWGDPRAITRPRVYGATAARTPDALARTEADGDKDEEEVARHVGGGERNDSLRSRTIRAAGQTAASAQRKTIGWTRAMLRSARTMLFCGVSKAVGRS
jgi:hypothetical protein